MSGRLRGHGRYRMEVNEMTDEEKKELARCMAQLILSDEDVQEAVLSLVLRCPHIVREY